jgi:hypothetical protein
MELSHARNVCGAARLAAVAALTIAASTCTRFQLGQPAPRPDVESRDRFVTYARSVPFIGVRLDHLLGDEQPILYPAADPRNAVVGASTPMMRIEPEARAKQLNRRHIQQGRVVARLLSTGRYEPLGVHAGVNYLWIDSTAGGWRGMLVPERAGAPITMLNVELQPVRHLAAAARWRYSAHFGLLPWIPIDDMCIQFWPPGGPFRRLSGDLGLTPEMVGGVPDPAPFRE